jgi:hypothetical protein
MKQGGWWMMDEDCERVRERAALVCVFAAADEMTQKPSDARLLCDKKIIIRLLLAVGGCDGWIRQQNNPSPRGNESRAHSLSAQYSAG